MSWLIYLQYDDDSLSLYSNTGLLRRAKKAIDEVSLEQLDAAQLDFKVEDCAVKLSPQGIAQAQCDCPATSCCKHILSSILWMQQHPEQFTAATATAAPPTTNQTPTATTDSNHVDATMRPQDQTATTHATAPNPVDVAETQATVQSQSNSSHAIAPSGEQAAATLAQVLALSVPKTLKQVNKAARRLAYQIFLNWQQQPEHCQIEIQADKISFQTELSPNKVQLFPQLGFAGMLSDIDAKQQAATHLACLAQLFQTHAAERWQWPEDLVSTAATASGITLSADDLAFIAELQQMCRHFIQHGLSHLAKESVLSLHILNMQARAQNLPRLGSELRQLHGLMRQFLAEDVQVTEQQLFDGLALLYSYLAALLAVRDQPEALQTLRGSIQQDYQQQQFEHLIPLGCEWWQYDSGAHGLSLCLWDVQQQRMLEVTQARANHLDSTFNKDSAAQSGIWGSSLDYLLQHQLQLTQAKTSGEHRLSASQETRFIQKGAIKALSLEDFDQYHMAIDDWQQLDQLIHPQSSIQANTQRYVLLRHREIDKAELNELDQCFECRVVDQHGLGLKLSLPVAPEYRRRIKYLNDLILNHQPVATLVRLDFSAQQVQLIPCSLLLYKNKQLSIFSLDHHYPARAPKQNVFELIAGRIEKMLAQKKQWQTAVQRTPLELLIEQSQSLFEFYANIGRAQFDPQDQHKFAQLTQQFENLGLDLIAQNFKHNRQASHLSHALLQWRQLLLQLQRLQYKIVLEGQVMSH